MKKKSNFLCVLLSLLMCVIMIPSTVADAITVTTKSGQQINQNGDQIKGTEDGYSYELWNQNNAGTATMTLGEGGAYSCVWSNIENVLFRRGVDFDCTKTYKELGNISIEYDAEYNNPTQNTYLCVYGWTRSPLIEYYIVDSWGSWRPPGAQSKGQINVDGGTYDVYVTDRINQPSIDGNTTFKQYWSVRTSKRTSGTISVSTHFAEWEKMGMETGKLYEAALNVEGYQSSGTANVTKNVVTVGGEIQEPDPVEPIEPDENGYYFHSTFESGTDDWDSRGGTTVETVSQNAYKGSKCLSVTGRTDSWNGTARSLPVAAFVPGQSYSFSTMVMQDSTASEDFSLTLQYDLAGETNYANVAKATGAKGKWVQLANTSYTIPEGASNLLLYIETTDSTTSFFVDEAIGAVDGTVIKEETAFEKGDVNGDGVISVADITMLTNFLLAKTETITGDADKNGDGVINVIDLALLRKAILDLSSGSDTPSDAGYFTSTFETGNDGWVSRGGTTLQTNSANYYSGSSSLLVSGRESSWQGAAYELDPETYIAGNTYSFSAAVMQASGADTVMKMSLQYTDSSGETAYSTVASETVASEKWTKLENTAFTIPAGATDLILYIETENGTYNFYIDEAVGAAKGTASAIVTGGGVVTDTPPAGGVDISWIDPLKPMVAISFDDGAVGTAENSSSMRILNALNNSGFHSTFFYVGNWVQGSDKEAEVKKAYSMGMEIANHTVSHPNLTQKSASEIRSEYDGCAQTLKNIIGADPSPLLRLPYLAVNDTVKSTLSDVPMITCSIDTGDWNSATKDQMVSKIKTAMSDGSLDGAIVLAHETYDTTAEAMEELCPYLKSQGWQIVSISEMFAVKGKTLQGGQVYTKS